MNRLLCIATLLLIGFAVGCAGGARYVRTPLEGDVFAVQSKLYVVGMRAYKPGHDATFIAPPDWGTNQRMLQSEIDEYEKGEDIWEDVWKIYGTLEKGDRIRVARSNWVEAGSAFSGYLTRAEVLTGPYARQQLELRGLVLSKQTDKPVENWNPYEDPAPSPQQWQLDPRYLQKVDGGE